MTRKGGECVGGRRHSWLDPYSGVCDGCGSSRYQATLAHGAATMAYSGPELREAARAAVEAKVSELRAAVEAMPTARIISQWDLVSRRAVLRFLETGEAS